MANSKEGHMGTILITLAVLASVGGGYAYIDSSADREHDKIEVKHDALDERLQIVENESHRKSAQRAVWRYEEQLQDAKKAGNKQRAEEVERKLNKALKELEAAGG